MFTQLCGWPLAITSYAVFPSRCQSTCNFNRAPRMVCSSPVCCPITDSHNISGGGLCRTQTYSGPCVTSSAKLYWCCRYSPR
ncbi:hypothetical protein EDB19DRAFT_1806385 [Suillus lakei]|nr:hypothetical protein EDB19DRAFT_1806385 [Suillus lakei]